MVLNAPKSSNGGKQKDAARADDPGRRGAARSGLNAHFMDAPGGANIASVDHHRSVIEGALAAIGMAPAAAGETILQQLVAGKFWISTHPDMLQGTADACVASWHVDLTAIVAGCRGDPRSRMRRKRVEQ